MKAKTFFIGLALLLAIFGARATYLGEGADIQQPVLIAPSYSNTVATATSATNYLADFATPTLHIFTANTNANITFTNLAAGKNYDLIVDAVTSSVPCVVSFPANCLTNVNLNLTVTNGTLRIYNLFAIDGSTTNLTICDAVFRR